MFRRKRFDLDGDGRLNGIERALKFAVISSELEKSSKQDVDDEFDWDCHDEKSVFELEDALTDAGLDMDELMNMDRFEREFEIEAAGLDASDFEDLW